MTDTGIINKPLRILHLEDNPRDAQLIQSLLEADGITCDISRIETRAELDSALTRGGWDLILSDFSLPDFDGLSALALVRERSYDAPFILVSGTVGEDIAVASLHEGAADYLLKQRLGRLPAAIRTVLQQARYRAQRELAEEALRNSQEHFRRVIEDIFQFVPEALLVFTRDLNLYKHNKAFENLVRTYAGKLDYTEPEFRQTLLKAIQAKVLSGDCGEIRVDHSQQRGGHNMKKDTEADIQELIIEFNASRIVFEEEEASAADARLVVSLKDVTERKDAEKAARRVRAMEEEKRIALEASRMKSEFVASMSHELRTPLNGIIGFSEFLADEKPGKLNEKQKEYLGEILNSGSHLLELINDVLDLSKVEAGKMALNPETFSPRKAIQEVCGGVNPIALKKSIQIVVDVAPQLGSVTLDEQKFKQVLYNLLSNALKFTDEGGRIEIMAGPREENRFFLAVKDNGIGIKPSDMNRLFREFEQLDAGADRHYKGTGLGLALTRKFVELQGGSIEVESEPGKGSTFTVILGQRF